MEDFIEPLNPTEPVVEWPDDITLTLIQQRRQLHRLFDFNTRHTDLWMRIANYIRNHHQYEITGRQCQVKWYSLKSGYENIERLLSNDSDTDGYRLKSSNCHDRKFHEELSDEFWLQTGNYTYI
jgi:hypothetical protein